MSLDALKTALVRLLVRLDPPGLAPLFLSLTSFMSALQKREAALRASVIAFGVLAFFAFAGRDVMDALVMAQTYLALLAAERISHVLGATGQSVLTRRLGVVLAALAAPFVIDGVKAAWV